MHKKIWSTPGKAAVVLVLLGVLIAAGLFASMGSPDAPDSELNAPPGAGTRPTTPRSPETTAQTLPGAVEPTDPIQTGGETEPTLSVALPSEPELPDEPDEPEEPQYTGLLELPYLTADGLLSVDSVFPFSGMNPDDGMEEGTDLAAIMVTNVSDSHLTRGELTVTMADGVVASFLVQDLPAGKSALVCDRRSTVLKDPELCTDIVCEAEFADEDVLRTDELFYVLDGMEITLTNLTAETLTGIEVYCHTVLDASYLGGCVYRYPVDVLPAGQSTTILALDCFLGAEVVRITAGG